MDTLWLLLAAAGGYGLRSVRPGHRLATWAENQLIGTSRGLRYRTALAITLVDVVVHPLRSRRTWTANRRRDRATEFSGAMQPAVRYDPDWAAGHRDQRP